MQRLDLKDIVLERKTGFVLGPISLEIAAGSRAALIGPSGCGKTTLLRCIAGLDQPGSGVIRIGDRVVSEGSKSLVCPSERRIGFVFQDGALWPHMTATQQVRFVDRSLTNQAAIELLDQVGLGHAAKRRPAELSGGEVQRLALARALAGRPDILLLDEPLASVDVHLRDELSALVRRLASERAVTMIVVTHDREEALAMADDIVVVDSGRVVEQGAAIDLLRSPKTMFAARFLCKAACFPVVSDGTGRLISPFGAIAPPSAGEGEFSLVLLPGDVCFSVTPSADNPIGRVLELRPGPTGELLATVELDGRTLLVPARAGVEPGSHQPLDLCGKPRILRKEAV